MLQVASGRKSGQAAAGHKATSPAPEATQPEIQQAEARLKFYKSNEPGVRISGRNYSGEQPVDELDALPAWVHSHKAGVKEAGPEEQIRQLEEFLRDGVLTQFEFDDAKARILQRPEPQEMDRNGGRMRSTRSIRSNPRSSTGKDSASDVGTGRGDETDGSSDDGSAGSVRDSGAVARPSRPLSSAGKRVAGMPQPAVVGEEEQEEEEEDNVKEEKEEDDEEAQGALVNLSSHSRAENDEGRRGSKSRSSPSRQDRGESIDDANEEEEEEEESRLAKLAKAATRIGSRTRSSLASQASESDPPSTKRRTSSRHNRKGSARGSSGSAEDPACADLPSGRSARAPVGKSAVLPRSEFGEKTSSALASFGMDALSLSELDGDSDGGLDK